MTRIRIVLLLAVAAVVVGAFVVLRGRGAPEAPPASPPPPAVPAPAVPRAPVVLAVAAPADDRAQAEPCSRIPAGGLESLRAFYDDVRQTVAPTKAAVVPLFLGDLTNVPGELGRHLAAYAWNHVLPVCDPQVSAAGPGEFALGEDFVRKALPVAPVPILCANAADAAGTPLLRGWVFGDVAGQSALVVATASQTLQGRLDASDSGVRLLSPQSALEAALRDGEAEARRRARNVAVRVLLHHGTVEETAALVTAVPGVTVAFAARGPDLPAEEPHLAGGVPVFAPGRGLRFGWVVTVEEGRVTGWRLVRLGYQILTRGSPVKGEIVEHAKFLRDTVFPDLAGAPAADGSGARGPDRRPADPRGSYVGSQACATCHTEQTGAHAESRHRAIPSAFPKEALGHWSCLSCHVTGAFHRSGWKGASDTSDLAGVSCEACHGPGAEHVAEPKAGWGRFEFARCRTCHTPDRSPDFDAEELWKQWGHGLR